MSAKKTVRFAAGAATGAATGAVGASADDSRSTSASVAGIESTPGTAGKVQASAAASEAASASVSPALRRAREAAGIDERRFQGILTTLTGSGQADGPALIRKPYKEQGVLSAAGSRIRALGGTQLESDASWPSNDNGFQSSIQN